MKPKLLHKLSGHQDNFGPLNLTSADFSHPEGLEDTFSVQSEGVVDDTDNYIKSDDYYSQRCQKRQESSCGTIHLVTVQEIEHIFASASKMYGIAD